MSDRAQLLPHGWALASVGDIGDFVNGLVFKPSDWEIKGRPIIRIQNLTGQSDTYNRTTREFDSAYVVHSSTILVSWSATLDVFVWQGPEAILNQHIFKVVPPRAMPNHRFVRWALKRAIEEMWSSEHTHGTTMRHINRGPFLAHPLPLPPLSEQHRIVEAIESYFTRLDDAVVTLERVQRNLKRYRASVLRAAVEGRLVPTEAELARAERRDYEPASVLLERTLTERRRRWETSGQKGKYREPGPPDTCLTDLPEGWCWATVEQLGEAVTGTTPPTNNPMLYGGTLPFFKPTDLDAGEHVAHARQHLSAGGAVRARVLPAESILVTCIGATIGKTGLAKVECATNQQINALVPTDALRETRYLFWYFVSPVGRQNVVRNASSTTLPILNKRRFERLVLPVPPLKEQQRISAEIERLLSDVDDLGATASRSLRRCARLRQAILQWAFGGKLADQDPNDEPAAVLLERIKTERAAASPTKRTRLAKQLARKTA